MLSSGLQERYGSDSIAVTYTTAALVKSRIDNIDWHISDAEIEQFIYEAETIINCVMMDSLIATFDAIKHAILRSAATDIAAMCCLRFNPELWTVEMMEVTANLFMSNIEFQLSILSDPRAVDYLKSL